VRPQKFRHNAAITVACVVAFFGAVPLATSRTYLLPIILVPILVGVWGWRAGTDVSPAGLNVRALFGSRRVPWSHVTALVPADRWRVYAILTTGRRLRLPAVGAADLAKLSDAPTAGKTAAGGARTAAEDARTAAEDAPRAGAGATGAAAEEAPAAGKENAGAEPTAQ
jgi:hypothetical protein